MVFDIGLRTLIPFAVEDVIVNVSVFEDAEIVEPFDVTVVNPVCTAPFALLYAD